MALAPGVGGAGKYNILSGVNTACDGCVIPGKHKDTQGVMIKASLGLFWGRMVVA